MREQITLACSECKSRNYIGKRNKKKNTQKVELMKFCKFDRKHTLHKETK